MYPGNTLDDVIHLYDIWGNDITNPNSIPIEFADDYAFTNFQPATLSSRIEVNCSSNPYINQSAILYIHPYQFPGVTITLNFSCYDSICHFCDRRINCYSFNCNANGYSGYCPNYTLTL